MYRSYIDLHRMRWCELFIGFCFLLASFWSKSENCADGRIEKRGVEKDYFDDSEFIRALSQQLYSRDEKESRRDPDDAVGGFVVEEKEETKSRRDLNPRETKVDQTLIPVEKGKKENSATDDRSKSRSSGGGADGVTASTFPYAVIPPGEKEGGNGILIIVIAACVVVGVIALIGASVCIYGMHDKKKQVQQIPYTPGHTHEFVKISPQSEGNYAGNEPYNIFKTDKNLAISAERFHYQHEKEKIVAMENEQIQNEPVHSLSMDVTDEIYATAGIASMWGVEFISPVYTEDVTPGSTPRDVTPVFRRNSDDEGGGGGGGSGESGEVTRPLTNGRKTPESPEQQQQQQPEQQQQHQRSNDSNPTSASTNVSTNINNNYIYPNLDEKADVKINGINDHLESEDEQ